MAQKLSVSETKHRVLKLEKEINHFRENQKLFNTFAAAIDQSVNSIIIINIDGIIQYANPRACRWYNLNPDTFIGKQWKR